jgi:HTH-type transcriptional regulator/antitoxin HigA
MTEEKIPTDYEHLLLETRPAMITTDREYKRQLKWIDKIMMAEGSNPTCEGRIKIVDLLTMTVQAWEEQVSPTPKISPREMLLHCMEARDLTQANLATELEVSPQLMSAVCLGNRVISRSLSAKLSKYFDLPIEMFVDTSTKAA